MKDGRFDVTDRISQLPEEILHHILSFLLVKDAFRTSLLSKSWHNACRTLPYLNFGENFFPKSWLHDQKQEAKLEKTLELLDVVGFILTNRLIQGGSSQKFWLLLPEHHWFDLTCYIKRFVGFIADDNIKELAFKVGQLFGGCVYTLPEAVYAAKSLTKLDVSGFKMVLPLTDMKLSSLRELYLFRNYLDTQLLQLFMTSCPDIEILELDLCDGFNILQITGLLQLKRLKFVSFLENYERIEIHAPNLEHLHLDLYGVRRLPMFNATVGKNLKIAVLYYLPISAKLEDDFFSNFPSNFPLLETLKLRGCEGLKTIRISSNHLKNLLVYACHKLLQVEIDAPNLLSFAYGGSISLNFSLKALAVQHITFRTYADSWSNQWQKNLIKVLGNFNHSKAMILTYDDPVRVNINGYVRERLCPPLYDVKHLSIEHDFLLAHRWFFLQVLDNVLWVAPRLDTLSIVFYDFKANLQFIYENHKDEVEYPCCKSLPIKCWRCSLKTVRFVHSKCHDVEHVLKEYLVENAKILVSIDVPLNCQIK